MILQVLFESNENYGHSIHIFRNLTRPASIFEWPGQTMEMWVPGQTTEDVCAVSTILI